MKSAMGRAVRQIGSSSRPSSVGDSPSIRKATARLVDLSTGAFCAWSGMPNGRPSAARSNAPRRDSDREAMDDMDVSRKIQGMPQRAGNEDREIIRSFAVHATGCIVQIDSAFFLLPSL